MVSGNFAADPVWGPYGQRSSAAQAQAAFDYAKTNGLRWITWVETYGDCMLYAAALERQPDGSFPRHKNDPELARLARTAWNWESERVRMGNVFRWVGLHNAVNSENFVQPHLTREKLGLPAPTYPDGRRAVGWREGGQYPLNALVYEAVCSKDINGRLAIDNETLPEKANQIDPATGQPAGATNGLYGIHLDANQARSVPGHKEGDTVFASILLVGKDPAAPFWTEYIRVSVRDILRRGVDGLWCDNYSPFNNFGMPALRNGFGDWSEHRFRQFLRDEFTVEQRREMGIESPEQFDVRAALKQRVRELGARNPESYFDKAWRDPRWLDDPVWNAYKVFKQRVGQEALKKFYRTIKEEAAAAGRPDFLVAGNDMPVFGLGWARDEWLDMVSTELSPAWHVSTGSRGIMIPPHGKMAVVYRAGLAHQNGPYGTAWYYLRTPYDKYLDRPEIAKVLMAEAFANGFCLKYGDVPAYPGTPESAAWWNGFLRREETRFGQRIPRADIGVVYSPDNQLAEVVPGSHAVDHNRQPHAFAHWGLATLLVDLHLPYRVVPDWKIEEGELKKCRTLYLPNVECLDDRAAQVVQNWVRAGGRLVMTGATAMRHGTAGFFHQREVSALADLAQPDMKASEAGAKAGTLELAGADPTKPVIIEGKSDPSGGAKRPPSDSPQIITRTIGNGTATWIQPNLGMDYYLAESRPAYLEQHQDLLRFVLDPAQPFQVLQAVELPSSVGAFCWESLDGEAVFVDLVNYRLDPATDRITPHENLKFRVRLPADPGPVVSETITPDAVAPATIQVRGDWVEVELKRLEHYASVKIARRNPRPGP